MADKETRSQISRRKFLAWSAAMAASAGIIPILEGCSPSTPTPTQAPAGGAAPPAAGAAPTGAPAQAGAATPQSGGTLRMVEDQLSVNLGYPQKMASGWSIRQSNPVIERLWNVDQSGKVTPMLATDFKTDATAKTITISLRQGVKFHDGTDFNADAVKWNLDKAIETKQMATAKMKSVDKVDDSTVRINLASWDNTVQNMLAMSYVGMMISPTAFQKNGEDWAIAHPIGTGPFQFVSWEKDVKAVYKKFDGYWQKGKPYLDGIEINWVVDPVVKLMTFRKGDADVLINTPPQEMANLEKEGFRVVRWAQYLSAPWGAIFDSANPKSPFSDVRVRQAAQYAIDCPALVKGLLFGESEAPTQMASKADWAYNPDIVGYPYNPTKAKQLLADAGYPNGFKTKYTYQSQSAPNQSAAEAVARYLGDVGIQVELNAVPNAKLQEYEFGGTAWEGLVFDGPPPYADVAGGLRERYWGDGKNFSQMLAPDDYKQAIDNAVTAPDFDTKQKWTREALKLMTDKYELMLMFYFFLGLSAEQTYVNNTGIGKVPSLNWTPADTWMAKK